MMVMVLIIDVVRIEVVFDLVVNIMSSRIDSVNRCFCCGFWVLIFCKLISLIF